MSKVSSSANSNAVGKGFTTTQTQVFELWSKTINGTPVASADFEHIWTNPTGSVTKLFKSGTDHNFETAVYELHSTTINGTATLAYGETIVFDPRSSTSSRSGNESGAVKVSAIFYIMLIVNALFG